MAELKVLRRPLEVLGVRTPAEYQAKHEAVLWGNHIAYPASGLAARPWRASVGLPARVTGGKWVVDCGCGDCPSADPEWDVARCLGCGAVFEDIAWPAEAAAIEALLVRRPMKFRHWTPGESIEFLQAENVVLGLSSEI